MDTRTIRRGVRLAANIAAAIGGHEWGDQYAQGGPDGKDPLEKGHPGPDGRRRCLRHVRSYTLTVAAAQLATNTALGIRTRPVPFVLGHTATGALHYVMDRSRESGTLPRQLSQLPGMPDKTEYFNRGGQPALDQAWHWVCLMGWAVIDAVAAER
ncbi:hypothetical protein [Bounagaea algeriensis]